MSKELINKSKVVLADTFIMYMKSHAAHWNVVGPDFPQLHNFFGDLYEELHDSIDTLAEHVRQLDTFAPCCLSEIKQYATIEETENVLKPMEMVNDLYDTNEKVIQTVTEAYNMAEELKMFGYSNYLQDRLTTHFKHRWMLKSIALRK